MAKLVQGDMRRIPARGALVPFTYGSAGNVGDG